MIARNAAAETMVATLTVLAVKARALLAMERAAGPEIPTRHIGLALVPGHTRADHGRYRHAVAYLIKEVVGKAHDITRFSTPI